MRNIDRWHSKYELDKLNTIAELFQEFQQEYEALEWQCACIQEEALQNARLWKNYKQFIEEKGLSDEYMEWIRKE